MLDLPNLPPNPHYGSGFFIRALQITTPGPGKILLGMEDIGHALQIYFEHDTQHVTAIDARWHRHPLSACPGAAQALQAMVGCPLSENLLAPQHFSDSRQQCTHFFDMLRLGISHAWFRREDRRYDVVIKDAPNAPLVARLTVNDRPVMALTVQEETVVHPYQFAGVNIFRGFSKWAEGHLSREEFEYAFLLQKGLFVARGRKLDLTSAVGQPAELAGPPTGSCYASQRQRYIGAVRLPTHRDFSETPEEVLRFFPLDQTSQQ